ncbi:MAG: hypothetical protein PUD70_06750 [Firmicutes bacterium]|nr:hypothetical protein [Clostridiales bacterium]MDD5883762.1 hypothetical protein [Bacillota bacterium]
MSTPQSFRSAFNGFNREDVVHYLEYLNTKHNNQINQLTAENESLRQQVDALPDAESQRLLVASLEEKCAELTRQLDTAQTRCAELEQQLEQATAKEQPAEAPAPALSPSASDELEAYRRAERIEREAKERAELVYFQATNVLTEASAKVDGISSDITEMADKVMTQLTQLQVAVSSSKQALQDASSIMGAIRPNQ